MMRKDGPLASILKTNSVAYVFFAFLFVTLARPVTMINMRFMDVVPPDLLDAENLDFPNRYVRAQSSDRWLPECSFPFVALHLCRRLASCPYPHVLDVT